MKFTKLLVLVRHRHTLEVLLVADRLEVAADDQQFDAVVVSRLELCDVGVYRVELAMTASFDCNL